MAYLVGIDEAGYGPNLGPLLISASVWQLDERTHRRDGGVELADVDLYARLAPAVTAHAAEAKADPEGRLALADSKALYQPSRGLAELERGVLACLAQFTDEPMTWRAVWQHFAPGADRQWGTLPWYAGYDPTIPVAAEVLDVAGAGALLGDAMAAAGVRLLRLRSRPVFPRWFNELVNDCGTKAAALSELSVGLVAELLRELPPGDVHVTCDKHGGRSRYAGLLQHEFPDARLAIRHERRDESAYRLALDTRTVDVRFCVGGERYLPAAVASMVSKYLRELAMRAFNQFWCTHLPDLKPTAGYPQDARRFKMEIAATQRSLGIDDTFLWRTR